jgi:hypothetical protein
VQQVCGDLLSAGQATGLSGLWNQRNYPIIDVDNPGSPLITTNIDAFVKEIVIFTCDGWAGPLNTPGHACNGPVLTGAP